MQREFILVGKRVLKNRTSVYSTYYSIGTTGLLVVGRWPLGQTLFLVVERNRADTLPGVRHPEPIINLSEKEICHVKNHFSGRPQCY